MISRCIPTVALMVAASVPATEYFVSPDGHDGNPGTLAKPFRTMAATALVLQPGDICTLRGGRHVRSSRLEGLHGRPDRPIVLRAGPDGAATLDGTVPITGPWTVHRGNIYKTSVGRGIWQLFVDGEVLNPARWPNAGFLDDPIPPEREAPAGSIWDQKGTWGKSSAKSTPGHMIDDPAVNDLAASGLDITGAVAILNIGSFKTADSVVTRHTRGSGEFDYDLARLKGQVTIQKPNLAYYYLEGKLEFLDAPGEWFLDRATRTLYLWTRDGTPPDQREIRGKAQSYAIDLVNCSHITIRGVAFHGTTLRADSSHHITVEDCRFRYPSCSKRMLRVFEPTDVTRFGRVAEGGPESSGNTIRNCEFAYTEGEALIIESHGALVENSLFEYIDPTCSRLMGIGNTFSLHRSDDSIFRRNTVRVCGASETLCAGPRMLVELNRFSQTGYVQNDGSMIHYMQGQAVDSITRFNWLHDSVKSGYRIDGPLDMGNTGEKGKWVEGQRQTRGTIYGNVAWNCATGFMVKGDYHTVVHNTGVECTAKDISLINVLPDGGNRHSIGRNNAVGAMDGFRGNRTRVKYPLPPLCSHNWIGLAEQADVRGLLRDAGNLDFRPMVGSALVDRGSEDSGVSWHVVGDAPDIGAYERGTQRYWIAGHRLPTASTPVPPNGSKTVKPNADLMWLEALDAANHDLYLGTDRQTVATARRGAVEHLGTPGTNIVDPGGLNSGQTYYWRVDANGPHGTVAGHVWSFTVKE